MPRLVLDRFLPYRLSVAANAVSTRVAAAYEARFGLSIPEWRVVAVLGEEPRLTPAALAERTRMDRIAISRAAAALRARGIVAAEGHPSDGRSHYLSLTPQGAALYAEVSPLALGIEAELLATFSDEERNVLEALLIRIESAALEG